MSFCLFGCSCFALQQQCLTNHNTHSCIAWRSMPRRKRFPRSFYQANNAVNTAVAPATILACHPPFTSCVCSQLCGSITAATNAGAPSNVFCHLKRRISFKIISNSIRLSISDLRRSPRRRMENSSSNSPRRRGRAGSTKHQTAKLLIR